MQKKIQMKKIFITNMKYVLLKFINRYNKWNNDKNDNNIIISLGYQLATIIIRLKKFKIFF